MANVKPKKCCYPNCFDCPYVDCINDKVTDEERKQQNNIDKLIEKEKIKEERKKKGKELVMYDYNHSDKGKERLQRYYKSDKGKAKAKRSQQKRIANGKNAEACKRYYYKKKAEKELLKLKQA